MCGVVERGEDNCFHLGPNDASDRIAAVYRLRCIHTYQFIRFPSYEKLMLVLFFWGVGRVDAAVMVAMIQAFLDASIWEDICFAHL